MATYQITVRDYVVIARDGGDDGPSVDDDVYPVDTLEQIEAAEIALREAGIAEAAVWTGEGPDAVRRGSKIFAAAARYIYCHGCEWVATHSHRLAADEDA